MTNPLAALRAALFSAYAHGLIRFVRDADEGTVAAFIDNMLRANDVTLAATPPAIDPDRLARALDRTEKGIAARYPLATEVSRRKAAAIIAAYEAEP